MLLLKKRFCDQINVGSNGLTKFHQVSLLLELFWTFKEIYMWNSEVGGVLYSVIYLLPTYLTIEFYSHLELCWRVFIRTLGNIYNFFEDRSPWIFFMSNQVLLKYIFFLLPIKNSFVDYVLVKGEIIWYLSLTAGLISLSIMLSSSIHAVAKGISSFFLSAV